MADFRVTQTIELKPQVNQADLRTAATQVRELIQRMNIQAKVLMGTAGGFRVDFGKNVSPQQRGAVTGLARDLLGLKNSMQGVNEEQETMYGKSNRNIGTILAWAAGWQVAYATLNAVKFAISDTIKTFGDLEMAFIRIKQASGESDASFSQFTEDTFKVARATGVATTDIATAAKIWAQQGKSISESLKLTETATIAVNLTGQTTQETISELTGVMNAWGYTTEQTALALDKFAKVADKEAVEVKDLMEAFLNVGLTAKSAGVAFDELTGMITAVVTITRKSGSQVGDAFRTLFTRYLRADTLNTIQTLGKVKVFIDEFGNATYRNTGKIRKFTDVYRDLVKVMPTLAETTQAKLVEQMTGVRRGEIGRAMFAGEGIVNRVQTEQVGAYGYAIEKNTEIMGSWEKKVAVLGIAFQQLGQSIAQSGLMDGLKNLVDSLTAFLDILRESREGLTAFYRIFIVIASSVAFTKFIFNLDKIVIALKGASQAAIAFKYSLGIIGLAGGIAITALLSEIKKTNDALKQEEEAIKNLYQVTDSMKSKMAGMSSEQREERRVKLLSAMREQVKKGNTDNAIRLANEIKELDVIEKTSSAKEKSAENTIKMEEDSELMQKKQMENLRSQLSIMQSIGISSVEQKRYELEQWEKINDTQLGSVEHLQKQNALMEEYVKEVYSLADAYQKVVSEGIFKIVEGTGTLLDMSKELMSTFQKSMIGDAVDLLGEQFGIFNIMSSLTKSPIANAHIKGIESGSKLIVQAHIAGIQAGMAGQSSAQAIANMQAGGAAGGAVGAVTNAAAGGGGQANQNQNVLAALFGGAAWTKQKPGAKGTSAKNSAFGANAVAGALYGVSAYQSSMQSGGSPVASAAGGILQGIGMMGLMTGNPVTMLGGAVLMGVGMLISGMDKKKQTTVSTQTQEQTKQVTSRINVTNKQLEIVNRNLVSLRRGFEGWVMAESYYMRSRSRSGVNVQNEFALNMRRGAQ